MSERGPGHDKLRNTAQQAERELNTKQSAGKGRASGVKGSGMKESEQ